MACGLDSCGMLNGWDIAATAKRVRRAMVEVVASMRATHFRELIVILLVPGIALAQEVFSGGNGTAPTTYSDKFSGTCIQGEPPNVFKQIGINPLVCHPQVGPQDSQKQCSYAGMTMVAHIGETCYYCVAIVPPINGIIIPMDQAQNAGNQGYSCVGDPVDPDCMIICAKPGKLTYTPPGPNGDVPAPRSGPPAVYTLEVPGPAGGIGYVPGPNPCIAGGGYNYCNNGPGAYLPPGCTCNNSTPSPEKSLNRNPSTGQPAQDQGNPPAPAPTHPTLLAIYKKMNDCLRAKLPYMPAFTPKDPYMTKALVAAEGSVAPSTPIDQVPFRSQVFILETAAALQAQAYHDQVYGPSKTDPNPTAAQDTLVGWFDRCLADAGIVPETSDLSPDNPPNAYATFLGPGDQYYRRLKFISGYGTEMLAPSSLLPPWTPPTTPPRPAPSAPNAPAH